MKRLREYLKERNIPEDSLEANSILEGYEKGYQDAIEKACVWIQKEVLEDYPYIIWPDIVKDFRKAMEE